MVDQQGSLKEDQTVDVIPDLIFGTVNGKDLLADLYLPKNRSTPLPIIIWLHGGGWRFGDRNLGPDYTRYFASRGFAMVCIEYRSSDEALFPAQVYDVKTAIRWVRSIAPEYGLDSGKIGLWGSSSGGHLAAIAAASGDRELVGEKALGQSSDVQAAVIGYGPVDFLEMDAQRDGSGIVEGDPESVQLPLDKKTADLDSFESLLVGGAIGDYPDRVKEASPLTYVDANLPPFLIMHGLADVAVPSQQSEMLYRKLVEEGNEASLYLVPGLGHGFFNRTHLDADGAKPASYWRFENGTEEKGETSILVFEEVERFFREKLCEG